MRACAMSCARRGQTTPGTVTSITASRTSSTPETALPRTMKPAGSRQSLDVAPRRRSRDPRGADRFNQRPLRYATRGRRPAAAPPPTGIHDTMRKTARAALFAACLATTPAAFAGDFFINGQGGLIELDSGFEDDRSSLLQASLGYRWGIGYAQVGLEGGLGRLGDTDGQTRLDYIGGTVDRTYTLSSRYGFVGANARIKPPLLPVYFIGRAGVLGLQRELDETAIDTAVDTSPVTSRSTFDDTSGGTYAGVGIGTTILPLLDVGLMLNQYRTAQVQYDAVGDEYRLSDDKRNARSVSLTVEYRF